MSKKQNNGNTGNLQNEAQQSGTQPPYPQSGMQPPYPQSGMQPPYPQSGMQPPYPQSGMQPPYPQTGLQPPYPDTDVTGKKKASTLQVAVIAIVAVAIVGLAAFLIVYLQNQNQQQFFPPPPPPGVDPGMMMNQGLLDYSAYSQYEREARKLVIDGEEISLPQTMLNINDLSYISLQDFSNIFGFETVLDLGNKQATITKGDKKVTFSNGIASAILVEGDDSGEIPLLDKPMLFTNGQTYIPLRSMKSVFNFESVEWDQEEQTIIITTDGVTVPVTTEVEQTLANVTVGPPPGGPPPDGQGGQPPQGGQMPQDGQPPQPPGQ